MGARFSGVFLFVLAWAALVGMASPVRATQILHGYRRAEFAKAPYVSDLGDTEVVHLAIGFPLQHTERLKALIANLYNPKSPQYRHFLTPKEFADQFCLDAASYGKVDAFLTAQGLRTHGDPSHRLVLDVEGSARTVDKAFHIHLRHYRRPDGSVFRAPDVDPSLDLDVPIAHIAGLENFHPPHPRYPIRAHPNDVTGGSGPGQSLAGNDFRNAYVPGVALDGSGQSVALFEVSTFDQPDVSSYQSYRSGLGLPNPVVTSVLVPDGLTLTAGADGDSGEVVLDIDMAMDMAPGAQVLVYMAQYPDDVLNQIAADDTAAQISNSWAWQSDGTTESLETEFAAQGQSYLSCSGDFGGSDGLSQGGNLSDPLQTLVGGTNLTMSGGGAAYASEAVWQDSGGEYASGGGILTQEAIPSYQQPLSMAGNDGSTQNRNVPDVAIAASDILQYQGGTEVTEGGTSAACPLWAGFMALVNEQCQISGVGRIGFANPALYSVAENVDYTGSFHDVTVGTNAVSEYPFAYPAVAGYDLATGLGSPRAALITNLVGTLFGYSPTASPTATSTDTPSATPSVTPSVTVSPTITASPTISPTYSATPSPSPDYSATQSPSPSAVPTSVCGTDMGGLSYNGTTFYISEMFFTYCTLTAGTDINYLAAEMARQPYGPVTFGLAIYTDAGGQPGSFVAGNSGMTAGGAGLASTALNPVFVPAGNYWMAVLTRDDNAGTNLDLESGGNGLQCSVSGFGDAFPASLTATTMSAFDDTLPVIAGFCNATATVTQTLIASATATATPSATPTFTEVSTPGCAEMIGSLSTNTSLALSSGNTFYCGFAPASSGLVDYIDISLAGPGDVALGIYTRSFGTFTMLAETAPIQASGAGVYRAFFPPISLDASTVYFLAAANLDNGAAINFYYVPSVASSTYYGPNGPNGLPSPGSETSLLFYYQMAISAGVCATTPTVTPSVSPSYTPSSTITPTFSVSQTLTESQTFTLPPTCSPSFTESPSASATASPTASPSSTCNPTETATPVSSATPDVTPSATPSPTFSTTPDLTASATPDLTASATPDLTASATPDLTASATPDLTASATPDLTASATPDLTASATPDLTASATPDLTASATPDLTASATPDLTETSSQTSSATPDVTETATPSPTSSISPSQTGTASLSPTESETGTASLTPNITLTDVALSFTPTNTPSFLGSRMGKSLLVPVPVHHGQPMCLFFAATPVSSDWEIYALNGERVASLHFGGESQQCWDVTVAPGIYFARLRVQTQAGSEDHWQKIAVLP